MGEAVEEIAEYVTDPDPEVVRGAVIAIGKMGIKVPSLASVAVDQLMKFLEVRSENESDASWASVRRPSLSRLTAQSRWQPAIREGCTRIDFSRRIGTRSQ